jgi:hypothetical protein
MPAVIDRSAAATNVVVGKILHKESGAGIPDLLVDLFDLDAWQDPELADGTITRTARSADTPVTDVPALYKLGDRIGSVITDDAGNFRFNVRHRDFNTGRANEAKPDLLLVVLAPAEPGLELSKRVLYLSQDVRFNAGSQEAYVIRFNGAFLKEHDIPFGAAREQNRDTPIDRVSAYVSERTREREFKTGVAEYHKIEIAQETAARSVFRKDFMKQVATDLQSVAITGVVVQDGDRIDEKNTETVSTGVAKANAALGDAETGGVPVNLYLTPDDRERLSGYLGGATSFVDIPDSEMGDILFRTNSSENPGTLLVHNNPIASFCTLESAEEKCAREHAGVGHSHDDTPPADDDEETSTDVITTQDIPELIGKVVRHMPSPNSVLMPDLGKRRADKADLEKAVNELALPKGPAEVPAFYDFHSLQIAFDHVWKQLFDENIPNLAYTANTIGRTKYGVDNLVNTAFHNGFSLQSISFAVTPVEVPPVIARFFDVTKEEYNEMTVAIQQTLLDLANRVESAGLGNQTGNEDFSRAPTVTVGQLRARQLVIEQGERLIDSVRHDNYYTLHRTLRDLHDRMSGTYEFTVFAADKDYHSVNFGLLNTYRQQWTPLTYQAGKLVKTIPLAPKEERKYAVKNNKTEKRAYKEAKKNNSSLTNEQNTTSRVEAEIMSKAQTKTNFGITAEGEYDIALASGKSTTTFGVEALQESAQNRKDFREAVLKAVQDYKDENSTEITTEFTDASEVSESGTITNPNDELSVSFLFYELQKRYRICEQIYRVMPVVLVAQEVPAPNRITESWVISHDWILNRHLLDDSFRPTLQYLAKKSVGDDFALRELRKNLRQQRNLVETLRIEFSAASVEADNRYRALETAITDRIDEEHDERTDGWFSDVGDFFGGGGQDPEAAKARELAAKDAHQYALEKAEKVAVSLRQEVNTLHTLTEAYNKTLQMRLDNETQVKRLLVHIRNNIFYYMQAIWSLEPPDQRFLRLHKVRVPILELESRSYRVNVETDPDIFAPFREPGTEKHKAFLHGKLKHNADGAFDSTSLAEVAQLDNLLGFKGNYMVFPLKEHNALTEFMAAPYIDRAFGAMDPDELANVSLEEFSRYVCCLHAKLPASEFTALKPYLKEWLEKLLAAPVRNGDEIVVPTGALFIEALVDPNAILEDFKLKHRELDVFSADQDVRRKALENLRLAARLLNEERGDPDVEKQIVVQGNGVGTIIDVDN